MECFTTYRTEGSVWSWPGASKKYGVLGAATRQQKVMRFGSDTVTECGCNGVCRTLSLWTCCDGYCAFRRIYFLCFFCFLFFSLANTWSSSAFSALLFKTASSLTLTAFSLPSELLSALAWRARASCFFLFLDSCCYLFCCCLL